MSDPYDLSEPRVEEQDGAVRDVNDQGAQQDTASGGAPDEPDTSEEATGADSSPEDSAS